MTTMGGEDSGEATAMETTTSTTTTSSTVDGREAANHGPSFTTIDAAHLSPLVGTTAIAVEDVGGDGGGTPVDMHAT